MTEASSASFFQKYFEYVGETESPLIYHRWAAITMASALLGRRTYFPFGHFKMYPSHYTMLVGNAGARKSSAIAIAEKLAQKAGYDRFAADRVSKEMFLASMQMTSPFVVDGDDDLEDLLDLTLDNVCEICIAADEFSDFVGVANIEFLTMLTKLWDGKDKYTHPKLSGNDVVVENPTVAMIAGATPVGLTLALPPEVVGQGFLSRLILVYSEPSDVKITFPKAPCNVKETELVELWRRLHREERGAVQVTETAWKLLDKMYKEFVPLADHRFASYGTRRFSHLLRLVLVLTALADSRVATERLVLEANTLLHYTECRMPRALAEFGKGKYSSVQSDIMQSLINAKHPLTMVEIWQQVGQDLTKQAELTDIMKGLILSNKVRLTLDTSRNIKGFTVVYSERKEWGEGLLLDDYLHLEEM